MYLNKLVRTNTGKYIMSILLGIGLATIFRSVCKGKDCIIYSAPPLNEIEDKIYKFDEKCYKYERQLKQCNSTKRIVEFA